MSFTKSISLLNSEAMTHYSFILELSNKHSLNVVESSTQIMHYRECGNYHTCEDSLSYVEQEAQKEEHSKMV